MKNLRHKSVLTLVVLVGHLPLFAQRINIGVGLGGMNYKGDLAPKFNPMFFKLGGHGFFRYNLSPSVSLRASGTFGNIAASDAKSSDPFNVIRNESFKTAIAEGSVVGEYNFLNYGSRRNDINWTPYLFGGLALYHFEPQARSGSYALNQLSVPFGIGVKYEISRPWNIEFEYGTRKLFTDYIDNIGDVGANTPKYRQSDPYRKDLYYYFSVSVSYTFYSIKCHFENE